MEQHFFEGESVTLRAVEPEDLDFLYRIENDSKLWDVSSFSVPYSKFVLKRYISDCQYDVYADRQLRLMIESRGENHTTIGTIDITDFSPQHSRGGIGIALLKEYRQKGIGNEAISLLCDYAFLFLHFHQLYAYVAVDNISSLSLFRSCNFVSTGILKDWLHIRNKWVDVVLMQRVYGNDIKKRGER